VIPYRRRNKWGYCDVNAKVIIETKFNFAERFKGNFALIQDKNDKWGTIDKQGNLVLLPTIRDKPIITDADVFLIRSGDNHGIMDYAGNYILSPIYDLSYTQLEIHKKYITMRKDSKSGLFTKSGKEVIPCKYENWIL
jgi:hypothetical protein